MATISLPDDWAIVHAVRPLAEQLDWSLKFLGIPELWKQTQGEGVIVAFLDTGVDDKHPDLQGQILDAADFTGSIFGHEDRVGHGCVAPTDQVYTSLCGLQPIEEVFRRVSGVTHFLEDGIVIDVSRRNIETISYDPGSQKCVRAKVLAVQKLRYSGPTYRVRTRDGELRLTPWHPVYTETSARGQDRSTRKKRADELRVGDKIVLSSPGPGVSDEKVSVVFDREWKCVHCGYVAARGERTNCRSCGKSKWHDGHSDVAVALDESLAYLAGLVISDGHLGKKRNQYQVIFTNKDERLRLIFEKLSAKHFGVASTLRTDGLALEVNNRKMWLALRDIGITPGRKSRTIDLPETICKSPRSVICAFIAGVIEGDGNVCKKTSKIRVATGSKGFADRLAMLCRTLGIRASVQEVPPSKTGIAKTDKPSWSVTISRDPQVGRYLRVKRFANSTKIGRRAATVLSVEVEQYDGPMYDFTVDKLHNYVANGHIVSNTWVCGSVVARSDNDRGLTGLAPKAKALCYKVMGDRGNGSDRMLVAGIERARSKGAHIISFSGGGPNLPDSVRQAAVDFVKDGGRFLFAAAGNDGRPNSVNKPAAWPEWIPVGACNEEGALTEFSSRGLELTDRGIVLPGYEMISTVPGGGYGRMSGTSMACPEAAGVAALLLARDMQTPDVVSIKNVDDMRTLFRSTATTKTTGKDSFALIDPRAALAKLNELPKPAQQTWHGPGGIRIIWPAQSGSTLEIDLPRGPLSEMLCAALEDQIQSG